MKQTTPKVFIWIIVLLFLSMALSSCSSPKEGGSKSAKIKVKESTAEKTTETKLPKEENLSQNETLNQPPKIVDISLIPSIPVTGDEIKAVVKVHDPDGDEVTLNYKWFINEREVEESNKPILKYPIKRGDKIKLVVVASDGQARSKEVVATATVENAPPKATVKKQEFHGTKYVAVIQAYDPEGDPITFELKKAPQNMEINRATGVIEWQLDPEFTGNVSTVVQVLVKDINGGEILVSYPLKVQVKNVVNKKK